MSGSAEEAIERLAKSMTAMRLRQARYVFDALYLRAVLTRCGGNVTKAAQMARVEPPAIQRIINRSNG